MDGPKSHVHHGSMSMPIIIVSFKARSGPCHIAKTATAKRDSSLLFARLPGGYLGTCLTSLQMLAGAPSRLPVRR